MNKRAVVPREVLVLRKGGCRSRETILSDQEGNDLTQAKTKKHRDSYYR